MLCKEVLLWRQFRHRHLLEFIGVCIDVFQSPAIVSPWMEKGDALQFVKSQPGDDEIATCMSYFDGSFGLY